MLPRLRPISYAPFNRGSPQALRDSFVDIGDRLISEVSEYLATTYHGSAHDVGRVQTMMEYNLQGGKMNRGLMAVEAGLRMLEANGGTATDEQASQLAVLGWCNEWMQGWALMADDIMDSSLTRRGRKAWYRHDSVQLNAINDAMLLEQLIYTVLKRHFREDGRLHEQLVDLFHETTLQTEWGQLLDVECLNLDLEDFTPARWEAVAKYKTSLYSFYLPVALAMLYAGVGDAAEFKAVQEILVTMGLYFQAQDDVLDCFGSEEQIGKIGTDISDKKCSWLFVHAYQHLANSQERADFRELYGRCTVHSPQECQIKDLYRKLGMEQMFQRYEAESYNKIMSLKDRLQEVPWEVFETYLMKIYRRLK